jgi:hypothetical protein
VSSRVNVLRWLAWLAICLPLLLGAEGAEAFDSELWPGEGVPRFAAGTDRLILHAEPETSSPIVAEHPVDPGQEITYGRTRFRTIDEGLLIAQKQGRLFGRNLGDVELLSEDRYYAAAPVFEEIPYAAGQTFAYLQYRAEGSCMIRHRGAVFEVGCPLQVPAGDFDLAREPVTQWWVEVTDSQGQALGWLQIDERVEFLPRAF